METGTRKRSPLRRYARLNTSHFFSVGAEGGGSLFVVLYGTIYKLGKADIQSHSQAIDDLNFSLTHPPLHMCIELYLCTDFLVIHQWQVTPFGLLPWSTTQVTYSVVVLYIWSNQWVTQHYPWSQVSSTVESQSLSMTSSWRVASLVTSKSSLRYLGPRPARQEGLHPLWFSLTPPPPPPPPLWANQLTR